MLVKRRRASPRSMHRVRARNQAWERFLVASTIQGRLRDSSGTPTAPGTPSCALATDTLLSSTIRLRALARHLAERSGTLRVRVLTPSTHLGRSWDFTPTIAASATASCALLTAPLPRSMLRMRGQVRFRRGPSHQNSLQWASTPTAHSPQYT